jgi:hypothetical protein
MILLQVCGEFLKDLHRVIIFHCEAGQALLY